MIKKILILSIIFIIFTLSACKGEDLKSREVMDPLVFVEYPSENVFEEKVFSIGNLISGNELDLVPEVAGTIKNMYVKEGQSINKGQKLFRFDNFTEREDLIVLESQLKTTMDNFKIQYDDAKKTYDNNINLFEKGAISQKELDSSFNEYKQKEKIYENSKVNYNKQISIKERQVKERVVYSPMSGIISSIYIDVNQFASGVPVLKITDRNSVHIESQVTVEDAVKISIDDMVVINVGGDKVNQLYGKIKYVDLKVNETGLVDLEISIDEPPKQLYEGQYVEVEIFIDIRNGIQIPRRALVKSEQESYVYVYDENIVKLKEVELGISNGNNIEILKGLTLDNRIVVSGTDKLKDGIRVRIGENK